MPLNSLEQRRREEIRWRILRALDPCRRLPVSENILFWVLHDVSLSLTAQELRRELEYLSKVGLVTLTHSPGDQWLAELNKTGIECVEYNGACPAIVRPPQV